jgi:hypothetical protein
MKTKLILLIFATFFLTNLYSQKQCGTMKNLEEQIKKDPSIKERMIQIEKQNQEWIEKNGRGFKKHTEIESNKNSNSISKSSLDINDLCGYNNTYFTTITAPTTLNAIVSPSPNCTYGGEYVTVNNLVAGRTYRISTIGLDNFDTQITIYSEGGGIAVAFNDDWQTSFQSAIYFTPISSGNYDILISKYGCLPEPQCASLEVELWYIPRPVITIPVVFHIFHSGEAIGTGTNISDVRIQSQIDALNEDFGRYNLDILSTPAAFRGVSADPLIQFCLAQQNPNGTPTNGIMRYPITEENLSSLPVGFQCVNYILIENVLKPNTIWNRDKYLNIWVSDRKQLPPTINGQPNNNIGDNQGCNFSCDFIGYAQPPGLAASTDGVWLNYTTVGRIDNSTPNYNLGTNATHEIGHWLNLKHIWGDEDFCDADDEVIDTPIQGENSNSLNILPNICPSFPVTDACSPLYPGIMFMNYMDYGFDQCKSMFTYGQFVRTDSVLYNQRNGLVTSQGCVPGSYKVVISQVYGGGGNAGNPSFTNDFIELYNRGTVAQNLDGLSVQYAPATTSVWQTISLPNVTLQPGQYYLIKAATQGTTITNPLPQEDFTSIIPLSASSGKVILVSNTTAETTSNPSGPQIIDKIGYGTANGFEGSATGVLSNTTAAIRNLGGCVDTDNNASDFTVGTPTPRNSSSTFGNCNSLSVTENENSVIALYPNPTNSKVFFDNSITNFKEVSIYNYLGQKVAKTSFTNSINNQEIDFSNLPTGVYILKFNNGESSKSVKVIKQ